MTIEKDIFKDLFIFEMANNHNGDLKLALKIVKAISKLQKKYGINAAVKIQYRDMTSFVHPGFRDRTDMRQIPRFIETDMKKDEYKQIIDAIKAEGMLSCCTPWDENSVDLCIEHDVDILKIASCGCADWPLIEKTAATKRPMVISFGAYGLSQIDKVNSFLSRRNINFALLHCIALYPVTDMSFQLDIIDKMIKRYPNATIGYSGHEEPKNNIVCQIAAAKGASVFERHVGVPTDKVKLNAYSLNEEEMEEWIKAILYVRGICRLPNEEKVILAAEKETMKVLNRGVYVNRSIKKGETITLDDIFYAIPCAEENQMKAGEFKRNVVATKDYTENDPLLEKCERLPLEILRSAIHAVRGILNENVIPIGDNFVVEAYHHDGMDKIFYTGAFFIDIVNREYCKRLVVLLPGQMYPLHHHKQKEESFQVLTGDLVLNVNNKTFTLLPGELCTVLRGDMHSFYTNDGVIFEELSTTYVKNDSFYDDIEISGRDPIERKTIIKDW